MEKTFTELEKEARRLATNGNWNEEAIEINKKIIEIDSKHSAAYTRLAKCLIELNDIDNAILLYKKVLTFDSENSIARNKLIYYGADDQLNELIAKRKLEERIRAQEARERTQKILEAEYQKWKEKNSVYSENIDDDYDYHENYEEEWEQEPIDDPIEEAENYERELDQLAIHDEMIIPYDWSGEEY